MRTILSIFLLLFGLMAFAGSLDRSDDPQLDKMELAETSALCDVAVNHSDAVVTNDADENGSDTFDNDFNATILPCPKRVETPPGYIRAVKADFRTEQTKSFGPDIFVPHRSGRTIYEY